ATLGPEHLHTIQALSELIWSLLDTRRYDRADPIYEALVAARGKTLGDNHYDTVMVRLLRAENDANRGQTDAAEAAFRELEDECLARFGSDHDLTLWAVEVQARLLERRGDAGAESLFRTVVEGARATNNPHRLAGALAGVGRGKLALRQWAEAEA